jgi:ADP-ribose diphosphatase
MELPATMRKKPQILNAETIAKTNIFRVEKLDLRFANGVEAQYERLNSGGNGAVLVVPMLDNDTVLLIREYFAGVDRYELALPKGRIEATEDPLVAANREIKEEIGYGARQLRLLKSMTVAPTYLSHTTHIILAEDLYEERLEGDEPEEIEVVPWRLDQLDNLLIQDECTEARSIAALYMVRDIYKTKG